MTGSAGEEAETLPEVCASIEVPTGWTWIRTGQLFEFVTSGSRGWARYYAQEGPRFLRVGNLNRDSISLDLADTQRVQPPDGPETKRTRVRPGDLLISITAEIGMVGLVPNDLEEAYVNQHVAIARPKPGLYPKYLAWYLATDSGGQNQLRELQRGATKAGLGLDDIRSVWVPFAPEEEQHRIVAAIEEHFTRLDAGIAALESAWTRLRRYRASVLKAACEGRLVPTEAELAQAEGRDYEPADRLLSRILQHRRSRWEADHLAKLHSQGKPPRDDRRKAKYVEPNPPETTGLPEMPEGWTWAAAAQIAEIQGGIQKQPKRAPKENAYPFLRVANVYRNRLDLDEVHQIELFGNEPDKLRLQPGDLLIVEGNGSPTEIGRMAIWNGAISDCVHQNHIIRARLLGDLPPAYVGCYWNSPDGSSRVMQVSSSTSGLHTLSVTKVSALPVALPPLAEQHRIVSEVERRLSLIDDLDAALASGLKRAERLRQAILKRAFSGLLVPQDPADEPASALLERLRTSGGPGPTHRERTGLPRRPTRSGPDRQQTLFE